MEKISAIDISNGTCYYAASRQAKDDYIPCGNVAVGFDWPCCVAGDTCLGDKACFHAYREYFQIYQFVYKKPAIIELMRILSSLVGVTYLAGCTDPTYDSPNCPDKGKWKDQQWTGLVQCGKGSDVWASCKESPEEGDVPGENDPAKCTCSPDTQVFTDKPRLDPIALLPTSLSGTISWVSGMRPKITMTSSSKPTSSPTLTSDSTSSLGSSTPAGSTSITGSPVVTSSYEPDSSATGPTLTTAAQAGIGVGACVGAIVIGCLMYLALVLRKRKKALYDENSASKDQPELPSDRAQNYRSPSGGDGYPTGTAFSGFKSELPADNAKGTGAANPAPSSLPTSPSTLSEQRRFQAYNPVLHGNYAEKSERDRSSGAGSIVSPLSPNSTSTPSQGTIPQPSPMSPVHELA
ncbi:hypothetical protein GGS26DRAFT_571260 [Hypomontagnella submonticulosa]|nr:hypothetical protein GGS26DRAFT_571260 [Hypomontagnella submonticulosa]